MRFSIETRWVNGVPHLQLRELESGEIRMQWRLVRARSATGRGRGKLARGAGGADTLAALIRGLLLVACVEDLGQPPSANRHDTRGLPAGGP